VAFHTNDPNAKLGGTPTNRSSKRLRSINGMRSSINHMKLPKLAGGTQSFVIDLPAMKSSFDNQKLANRTTDEIAWGIGASPKN
jgi:hypothetical protein